MEVFIGGRATVEGQDPIIARVANSNLLVDATFNRQLTTLTWATLANGTPANDDGSTVFKVGTAEGTDVRYNVATFFVDYSSGSSKLELWPMSSPDGVNWYSMTGGDLSSGVDTRKILNLLFDDGIGKYSAICRLCDGWFKLMACEAATGGGAATVKVLFGKE